MVVVSFFLCFEAFASPGDWSLACLFSLGKVGLYETKCCLLGFFFEQRKMSIS